MGYGLLILLLSWSVSASAADLTAMDETAKGFSNIKTVQVAHQGQLIWSKAYNGANINEAANIKSASKSVMSAIVGMAIDKGVIESVNVPVAEVLKDQLPANPTAAFALHASGLRAYLWQKLRTLGG